MASADWAIEGKFVEFCSCAVDCPCSQAAAPTHGHCNGVLGFKIDKGHYGDTNLDGIAVVALFHFPGAMHECDGHLHPILPEGISDAQRDGVLKILAGDGQRAGTVFDIFNCLIEHEHEPIYKPITFDWDIGSRLSTIDVPGVLRAATSGSKDTATDQGTAPAPGLMLSGGRIGPGLLESSAGKEFNFNHCHSSLSYFTYDGTGSRFFTEHPR